MTRRSHLHFRPQAFQRRGCDCSPSRSRRWVGPFRREHSDDGRLMWAGAIVMLACAAITVGAIVTLILLLS